jgi:cell division protein FtsQ
VLLVIAAIIMSLGVFFRVLEIEVEGQAVYSAEEVISASGVETGDNLFLVRGFDITDSVFGKLPYIESVSVKKSLPNKIIISVTESYPIAYFEYNESCYLFDANGKILEKTTADEIGEAIFVTGLTPLDPKPGQKLTEGVDSYAVD